MTMFEYDYEKDFSYEPYDPYKKVREINENMTGNSVWCRNGKYCRTATHCEDVSCLFKNNETRLATPAELEKCNTFQITAFSLSWRSARHIYPKPYR